MRETYPQIHVHAFSAPEVKFESGRHLADLGLVRHLVVEGIPVVGLDPWITASVPTQK
jgi:hypothetical protein